MSSKATAPLRGDTKSGVRYSALSGSDSDHDTQTRRNGSGSPPAQHEINMSTYQQSPSQAHHKHTHPHPTPQSRIGSHAQSHPAQLSPRTAYERGDVAASKLAHAAMRRGRDPMETNLAEAGHSQGQTGEYIKSIVYGGLDGIITTFATVTSVAGAEFSAAVIVVLGIAHLFADGVSMGMGDYMSSQAELDYTESERKREQWEMDNNMAGEIEEMIDLYMAKGVTETDARIIINTLAKYPEAFLNHMMVEELGLLPPDADQGFSPQKAGIVTMASFVLFGAVPLLPYLIALIPGVTLQPDAQLWIAIIATILTLFALGAFKGSVVETGRSAWWKSGLLMACNGSVAAAIGYAIGYIMSQLMDLPPGLG